MASNITVTIDGHKVSVRPGSTVLEAARAAGIYIPTLCYDPALAPYGACRLCIVEIKGLRGLPTACSTPAAGGMVVRTSSPTIDRVRRNIVELLLSDHPSDCLTCPQNNRCELQRLAAYVGVRQMRFAGEKRSRAIDDSNPFYQRDLERCILCGKCVRVCDEVQGANAIHYAYRGFGTTISTVMDGPIAASTCESCGQCVAMCPVGALRARDHVRNGLPTGEVATVCPYCGVGCGLILETRDARIVGVRGDPDSPVNRGGTCVKGRFGYDYVNHPDRLTTPLIRRDGALVEADWDEALDLVADRFAAIVREHGPDALAFLSSAKCTNEEDYLLQKLSRGVIGTHNIDHCARLCHSSTVTGLSASFGSGAMTNAIADIASDARAYLIIGSNITENHPVIGSMIRQAVRRRGAKLVVADPRRIPIASFATLFLQHRPGTDIALLNGLAHVLLEEGLYDKAYVVERTENLGELRATVCSYAPERVQEISGVPAGRIREAARILATHRPASLLYAMGITQHTTGHQNVLACANLQMLLGNVGVPGGGVNPLRGQNNVQGACDMGCLPDSYPSYQATTHDAARNKFVEAWGQAPSPGVGLTVTEILRAAGRGQIKGLFILGENPAMTDPDAGHARAALEKTEFLVVQDILPSETAAYADVILPGASFAEKGGTFTNTERRVQLVRPALDPPGKARPDWDIIRDLAERLRTRLGITALDAPHAGWDYAGPAEVMGEIAALTPIYGGIRHDRLRDGGLQWPCPSAEHPGTPILHAAQFSRGPGRFHGVEWLPPAEQPDDEYPLLLTTGRVLYHFHGGTMSRRSEGLQAVYPEGLVEINPCDAHAIGVQPGDLVTVTSRRGQVIARAEVVDRPLPGMVFMTFHFREAAANLLTNAALDPVAKIPEYKACAVRVERSAPAGASGS